MSGGAAPLPPVVQALMETPLFFDGLPRLRALWWKFLFEPPAPLTRKGSFDCTDDSLRESSASLWGQVYWSAGC